MRTLAALLVVGLLALAGCGDGGSPDPDAQQAGRAATTEQRAGGEQRTNERTGGAGERVGTTIAVGGSDFGAMLFSSGKRALYVFERDPKGRTVCYGDCAAAWPPLLTGGEPVAGRGVRSALLGTVRRRDGRRQVTYAGKPLYLYAHEGRGEVRCHNVNLNGGLWWVVGPDGKRRP